MRCVVIFANEQMLRECYAMLRCCTRACFLAGWDACFLLEPLVVYTDKSWPIQFGCCLHVSHLFSVRNRHEYTRITQLLTMTNNMLSLRDLPIPVLQSSLVSKVVVFDSFSGDAGSKSSQVKNSKQSDILTTIPAIPWWAQTTFHRRSQKCSTQIHYLGPKAR